MRPQAKPFAIETRKGRRPSATPSLVLPDGARPRAFDEAEKLFRPKPTSSSEDIEVPAEISGPGSILPDLTVHMQKPAPVRVRSSRRASSRPATSTPEVTPAASVPASPPNTGDVEGIAPESGKGRPKRAATKRTAVATSNEQELTKRNLPSADVVSKIRRRDPRPGRGEFLPGERWKRRLAPVLR